jgi:hypothetical protein
MSFFLESWGLPDAKKVISPDKELNKENRKSYENTHDNDEFWDF